MTPSMRGRPRLNLQLEQIILAVRRHQQIMTAARELGCSDSYIHVRLKGVGLTLAQILEASDLRSLLDGQG